MVETSLNKYLTDIILIISQILACSIYWMFNGSNLKYVLDVYTPKKYPLYSYMLMITIPHCLIMCVRNLKAFAPFSVVADILTCATFGVTFYYIFHKLDAKFEDRNMCGRARDFPLFYGTVMFSLQSIIVTLSVENNMGTPQYFRKPFGSLNVAYTILTGIYLFVAIFGYWQYGEDIKSSITMNFPAEDILAEVIILSYCLVIFVSYGLCAYVPISLIYDVYLMPTLDKKEFSDRKKLLVEMSIRLGYVILTCIISTTIPLLGIFISLYGSVALSLLGVILPGYMEIAAYWEENKSPLRTLRFWKDIGIILLGFLGLIAGLYASILSMHEKFSQNGDRMMLDL